MKNKNILIGVSGGIAAYKVATLVRLFIKAGANVKVIFTESAKDFVTPLIFATLSKNPVYSEFFDKKNGSWNSHIELSNWSDIFIIAPATANTIAKMALGISDNLLVATYLSATSKIFVAPAMDHQMYIHPATQKNIETLKERGISIIEPEKGELASGIIGEGRMAEPENIFSKIKINS